ncbi:HTH domain-containing protein [Lachnospiraceae bacterium 54-53]
MLTIRQINILTYLLSKEEWVTSERLSLHFDLNRKTIQLEIKSISESLGNKCMILTSHHSGYFLKYLSDDAQDFIREEVTRYGGRNSLRLRPSAFVLYFLFMNSYVTMQMLADIFYMSKSAVSLELNTVKRWVDRCDGIEMEVSNKNGIIIHAEEIRKRIHCAKFGTVNVFRSIPLQKEVVDEYEKYLEAVGQILIEAFTSYGYLVTGEEYHKNCRFIASCILRSRLGYKRPPEEVHKPDSPLTLTVARLVRERLGYDLKAAELNDIHFILEESSLLFVENVSNPVIEGKLALMEDKICSLLNIPKAPIFADRDMVVQHICKMHLRARAGNIALNHYNEDIVARYPLEAYLIYRLFPDCFQIPINKEISFLALFLASNLNAYRERVSILLVSDQNMSIINYIKKIFCQNVDGKIKEIKALPVYIFKQDTDIRFSYDFLLTTDQEVLFIDRSFNLINCIITHKDLINLNMVFQRRSTQIYDEKKQKLREKYLSVKTVNQNQHKFTCLDQIIKCSQDGTLSYHTIGNGMIYIGRISPLAKTKIELFTINFPVKFQNKKIRKVVFVQFRQGDEDILDFFSTVSDIIGENE